MRSRPSVAIVSSTGTPIAWAFLGTQDSPLCLCSQLTERKGPDGSLKTLHVEVRNGVLRIHLQCQANLAVGSIPRSRIRKSRRFEIVP